MRERDDLDNQPGLGVLGALRRRWWLVLLTAVVTGVAAYVLASRATPTYTATAQLLVRQSTPETAIIGAILPQDSTSQDRSASTLATLAGARTIAAATSQRLGDTPDASDIEDDVSVTTGDDSNVLTVSATDESQQLAARIANAYAQEFIDSQGDDQTANARRARRSLQSRLDDLSTRERRGSTGDAFRSQIEQLRALEAIAPTLISFIERADVPDTSDSQVLRTTVLGALFGLLLGGGLALLRDQVDRRVRRTDDLEEIIGLPVLAEVPQSRKLKRGSALEDLGVGEVEPFRMLRTRLQFFRPDQPPVRRMLVTSGAPQEGKSLVCWYLAAVAAASGEQVLLVEADLRRPVVAERHGLEPGPGLSEVVGGSAKLADAIRHVAVSPSSENGDAPRGLDVLPAGTSSEGIIDQPRIDNLVDLLQRGLSSYSLVIVDSAPIMLAAETIPLCAAVDGVLVVSRAGQSTRDALMTVKQQLDQIGAPVLGIVRDSGEASAYYGPAVTAGSATA